MTKAVNLATVGSNATSTGTVLTQGTAQASTSGTSVVFTGIPSWAKRVTLMLVGVSSSGANNFIVQVGSGSLTTSGYLCNGGYIYPSGSSGAATTTSGISILANAAASSVTSGQVVLTQQSGNTWVATSVHSQTTSVLVGWSSGSITLSGSLDRIAFLAGGADSLDAGSINILYE